jgi:hypothetical protein
MLDERVDDGLGVFAVERRTAYGRKQPLGMSKSSEID